MNPAEPHPGKGSTLLILALLPLVFVVAAVMGAAEYTLARLKRAVYGPDA